MKFLNHFINILEVLLKLLKHFFRFGLIAYERRIKIKLLETGTKENEFNLLFDEFTQSLQIIIKLFIYHLMNHFGF